jgi:hypothetical protein
LDKVLNKNKILGSNVEAQYLLYAQTKVEDAVSRVGLAVGATDLTDEMTEAVTKLRGVTLQHVLLHNHRFSCCKSDTWTQKTRSGNHGFSCHREKDGQIYMISKDLTMVCAVRLDSQASLENSQSICLFLCRTQFFQAFTPYL